MSFLVVFPILIACSVLMSFVLTPLVRRFAFRFGIVDEPVGGRKIHSKRTALLGGLPIGVTIISCLLISLPFASIDHIRPQQIWGFIFGIIVLMIGGALDDRYNLSPRLQIFFPIIASCIIVFSGSGIIQVTNPFHAGVISLTWLQTPSFWGLSPISFPADFITIMWLLVVTYAMKVMDGMDGLVAGLAAIGALLIAGLAGTPAFFQPFIAMIAFCVGGAYVGFLPFNKEGSIFLAESGSTIAGFSLAVLAIISGSKVATAAVAVGIPLVDIVLVVAGRLLRRVSPFRGDMTHIHFRLLQAGMPAPQVVRFLWGLACAFGFSALAFQTKGRLFLLLGLCTVLLIVTAISVEKAKQRSPRK